MTSDRLQVIKEEVEQRTEWAEYNDDTPFASIAKAKRVNSPINVDVSFAEMFGLDEEERVLMVYVPNELQHELVDIVHEHNASVFNTNSGDGFDEGVMEFWIREE